MNSGIEPHSTPSFFSSREVNAYYATAVVVRWCRSTALRHSDREDGTSPVDSLDAMRVRYCTVLYSRQIDRIQQDQVATVSCYGILFLFNCYTFVVQCSAIQNTVQYCCVVEEV